MYGAGCLSSSNLVLESWKIPTQLLITSLLWNPPKIGSKTSAVPQQQEDEIPSNNEGREATTQVLLLARPFMWAVTRSCGQDLG